MINQKRLLIALLFAAGLFVVMTIYIFLYILNFNKIVPKTLRFAKSMVNITPEPQPTFIPTPTVTPTPTPHQLTFAEMNHLYGPCVYLPVIFYHHIEDLNKAQDEGHKGLAVDPSIFASQMAYLKSSGYTAVSMNDLNNFFDGGALIPAKSIIISFDDGYNDFEDNAMPVIRNLGLRVIMFLPTGLVGNPGYLTWDQVTSEQGSGLVYFANHSWSHASLGANIDTAKKEIDLSETQLVEHGLNPELALAYPYGTYTGFTVDLLRERGFRLGFTTAPGSTLCKQNRLTLPRIRIGNAPLSAYGL